jgi:hypothetical protein
MNFLRPRYVVCVFLLTLLPIRAAAQEASGGLPADTAPIEDAAPGPRDTTEFVIRDIDLDISGFSRKFAILYYAEITPGERITGRENLEAYRLNKIQLLMNQRALDSVDIRCFEDTALEDGTIPVDLLIIVKDTWNIIALPYFQYDDNSGFELTLKARDYNFLGTLSPLRLDLGYTLDADKTWDFSQGAFNFKLDSDIPLRLFNLNWNINFDHDLSYTYEEPLYYRNTTGLSMELPLSFTTFTFGFDQSTTVNEDNEDVYTGDYLPGIHGGRFVPVYFSSVANVSWKIPTPLAVDRFGKLTYTPKISGKVNYLPAGQGDIDELRRGPTITLSHSLGFGRIDWIDNYRSGLEASISNSNTYNFFREDWDLSYDLSAVYHHIFTDYFGMSGRLKYRHWLDTHSKTAGDVLRGILDRDLCADYMFSLNLDFPLRALQFLPSQWFNISWLRLFNFDLHISPFFDLALARDPVHNTTFWSQPSIGAGVEIIVFPHFFRSLYLRISPGYDVNATVQSGKLGIWNELFIGIGHYY